MLFFGLWSWCWQHVIAGRARYCSLCKHVFPSPPLHLPHYCHISPYRVETKQRSLPRLVLSRAHSIMQLNRQGGKHGGIEEWNSEGEGTEHRAYLSKGTV
ncbi:hypothetical protein BJY00DRAFT_170520 [Aspergillus carlsbadensis]|nr:hypothetical protein BJY00DRAFT_170520 [Aspergillus carlsbadensis]